MKLIITSYRIFIYLIKGLNLKHRTERCFLHNCHFTYANVSTLLPFFQIRQTYFSHAQMSNNALTKTTYTYSNKMYVARIHVAREVESILHKNGIIN